MKRLNFPDEDRKKAFDNISRTLSIMITDIEFHQAINDLSLNIHGENYFRDVFNFIFDYNLVNANLEISNTSYIDLIDKKRKIIIQITSTTTKEKIEKTLKIFNNPEYKNYSLQIYYLIESPNLSKKITEELNIKYKINIENMLKDEDDLIKIIGNLETNKLIELNEKYFTSLREKYTDEIVLNFVINKLLKDYRTIKKDYDDDFGTIETDEKIKLNNVKERIKSEINKGLDYRKIINDIDGNTLENLRELVINDIYKNILIELLESKEKKDSLKNMNINGLHILINKHLIDFNKIISKLYTEIENKIIIKDFNSKDISWIIISYFFEICDIGLKNVNAE